VTLTISLVLLAFKSDSYEGPREFPERYFASTQSIRFSVSPRRIEIRARGSICRDLRAPAPWFYIRCPRCHTSVKLEFAVTLTWYVFDVRYKDFSPARPFLFGLYLLTHIEGYQKFKGKVSAYIIILTYRPLIF
jgi:hypothetical protein